MEHMLKTINVLFETQAVTIGLDDAGQLSFGPYNKIEELPDKAVAVFALRTLPDAYRFNERDKERYLTVLQVDIFTRSTDGFEPVVIRDRVFSLLDDRRMPRQVWTDPDNPMDAGEIKFRYQDEEPFSLAGNIRAISMTYELEWWKPRG